jgi:glycosyltransferase involved in cell wall biosynthesis
MRIAYLSVSDQLGGSEIALLEMVRAVRRLRPAWSLHVILPGRGPLLNEAEAAGADCVVLPLPTPLTRVGEAAAENAHWSVVARLALGARLVPVALALPTYLGRLRRLIRANGITILHTNGLKAHVLGARVAGTARVVWHIHEYVGLRRVTRTLLSSHQRHVAAILANSVSVATDVTTAITPPVPVQLVYNAVDLQRFAPEDPSERAEDLDARAGLPPASGSVVRVGLLGTFARWKGHEVFLRAMAALPRETPVRGYVIGEPLYDTAGSQFTMNELQALARQLGLQDRVGFTGFLRAAPAMRALDVVVHASTRPEPFGLVIAEAMASGRAVITSGAGGAAELVESGHDALTHAPGDVDALARCIARLAADPTLRRQLGARARATACRRFDPDRMGREIVAVYEQIAS